LHTTSSINIIKNSEAQRQICTIQAANTTETTPNDSSSFAHFKQHKHHKQVRGTQEDLHSSSSINIINNSEIQASFQTSRNVYIINNSKGLKHLCTLQAANTTLTTSSESRSFAHYKQHKDHQTILRNSGGFAHFKQKTHHKQLRESEAAFQTASIMYIRGIQPAVHTSSSKHKINNSE
jgi:hypothetical protein